MGGVGCRERESEREIQTRSRQLEVFQASLRADACASVPERIGKEREGGKDVRFVALLLPVGIQERKASRKDVHRVHGQSIEKDPTAQRRDRSRCTSHKTYETVEDGPRVARIPFEEASFAIRVGMATSERILGGPRCGSEARKERDRWIGR